MRFWFLVCAALIGCARASAPVDATSVVTTDTSLTFDPRTCAMESRTLWLGLGSASVEIIERSNDQCTFEFTHEVEGGYKVYRVSVRVDSGPVEIHARPDGSEVYTSFDLSDATLVRSGNVLEE